MVYDLKYYGTAISTSIVSVPRSTECDRGIIWLPQFYNYFIFSDVFDQDFVRLFNGVPFK